MTNLAVGDMVKITGKHETDKIGKVKRPCLVSPNCFIIEFDSGETEHFLAKELEILTLVGRQPEE